MTLNQIQMAHEGLLFKGSPREKVMHTLHCSVFHLFGASNCDAPWLSLKSVVGCVFGLRLCALERHYLFLHLQRESLLEPTLFSESACQSRERFR